MLLVHPPASRPCEPPPGLARLSGALTARGVAHEVIDANIEGPLHLAGSTCKRRDTWTVRAKKNLERNLSFLRSPEGCRTFDRYSRAVRDVERAVAAASGGGFRISLADMTQETLSPLRSTDLLLAAEHPDGNPFCEYFAPRLREAIARASGDVAGFSINYLGQAFTAFAMMGFLRREFPRLRIVAGGGLITSWMSRIDLGARFSGLVNRFVAGPGEVAVLGLSGVEPDGETRHAAPAYDRFPLEDYVAPGLILAYATSTGCFWGRCRFCPERAEENAYTPVPLDLVKDQLRGLVSRHVPAVVHFTDNALPAAVLRHLSKEPPGAPWYGFARVTEELADPGFCRLLAASGCAMLKLGLESGSDRVLDAMQKGFDTALSLRVLKALRDAGVPVYAYLLFGTPYETEEDADRTLKFAAEHSDCISFLNLAVFNLPTKSPDADRLKTRQFYGGDLSLYLDFEHPGGWDRRRIKVFLDRRFRRHTAIAPILRRDPPIFTSNHAAFFGGRDGEAT
ncbi:MAG: radical SAM protein [Deltaproteobacteria bacterium]|nr:radical SAM protein [Deltaproteobacteria bacterium]